MAQIGGSAAYGRVESVTVSVEGAKAKTTKFTYKDEPRRTTVSAEGEPATIYDIAPDGSVLKWWNTEVPPEIENLSGSLYANKETSEAIEPGDYELLVQAFAAEGIASIQIIANGNQLVDEKTCEKTAETNCKTVEDPWVTNTGNWPPGILQLEVIVTSSLEGSQTVPNTESAKFWVNIPYTPPPDPEAEEPPTFEEVLHFREEFGLDLDLKGNEIAIDERIFNLIGDWNNPHTPTGEVARATMETWGVPLRAVDAAELEYRERYAAEAARLIPEWAEAHAQSTYAGYYIDQRQGGDNSCRLHQRQSIPRTLSTHRRNRRNSAWPHQHLRRAAKLLLQGTPRSVARGFGCPGWPADRGIDGLSGHRHGKQQGRSQDRRCRGNGIVPR